MKHLVIAVMFLPETETVSSSPRFVSRDRFYYLNLNCCGQTIIRIVPIPLACYKYRMVKAYPFRDFTSLQNKRVWGHL